MGLETINSNSKPSSLNEAWPVGATDGTVFGAIHLRNIKTVLKNFYNDYISFSNWFDSKKHKQADGSLDSVFLAMAADTTYLNNRVLAEHKDISFFEGEYPLSMIPRATLTALGMTYASSVINSVVEDRAATIKACKVLSDAINEAEENAPSIAWYQVPFVPQQNQPWNVIMPSRALGWLEADIDVEFVIIASIFSNWATQVEMGYRSFVLPVSSAAWKTATNEQQVLITTPVYQRYPGQVPAIAKLAYVYHTPSSSDPNLLSLGLPLGKIYWVMYRKMERT